ncbi:14008_t:CDS:2, partial [Dentiscutata heterogama]
MGLLAGSHSIRINIVNIVVTDLIDPAVSIRVIDIIEMRDYRIKELDT